METLDLIIDFHKNNPRQGPGSQQSTIKALQQGITNRLTVKEMDMEQLAFAPESVDVIWAEGAIYNIGFSRGIREWRPLLKKDAYRKIVVKPLALAMGI